MIQFLCEECNHKISVEKGWPWDFRKCPACGHDSPIPRVSKGATTSSAGVSTAGVDQKTTAAPSQVAARISEESTSPLPPVRYKLASWLGVASLLLALIVIGSGIVLARKIFLSPSWIRVPDGVARAGNVSVQIPSVRVGLVQASTLGTNHAVENKVLRVRVRVSHVGKQGKLHYNGWTPMLGEFADEKNRPILVDDQGQEYKLICPGVGATFAGQIRQKDLFSGESLEDLLVFERPSSKAKYLHLRLPAANVGGEGEFRFQIPQSLYEW